MSTTAPATTGFALSPQQARWWALGGTDHPAFLARAVIEITGPLDVGRLEGALADLSARFEVLRTRFQALPGVSVPLQVIEEPSPLPLDKKTLGPGALPDALAAELEQLASQAIQGERKPLALRLLELGPERHALLLVQPSGLADRRGLENLCRELARSYQARLEGRQLEAEEVQYADLAQWQNEVLADPEHRLGGDYFADVAARGALALALPGRRAEAGAWQPAELAVTLPAGLGPRLEELATARSLPARAWLAAAWALVLSRLSGEARPLLGVALEGRGYAELEGALGPFEKHLPLLAEVLPGESFEGFARRLEALWADLERWQETFHWEQGPGAAEHGYGQLLEVRSALAPALDGVGGARFRLASAESLAEPFELRLSAEVGTGELELRLGYDARCTSVAEARALGERLATLLASGLAQPQRSGEELELLPAAERERLVAELSGARARRREPAPCLPELFAAAAARVPERPALVAAGQTLSYGQLDEFAARVAQALVARGLGAEQAAAILCDRTPGLIAAVLGCWRAGLAVIPLDPALPAERLRLILEEGRPAVLLTEGSLPAALEGVAVPRLDLVSGELPPAASAAAARPTLAESLAYVIFTSGSTGRPKGVGVEHRQLAAYVAAVLERLQLPDEASFASVSTFAADLGHTAIFPALATGGCLHLVPQATSSDPNLYRDYARAHAIDLVKIVPGHLEALLSCPNPREVLPRRLLVLGGEASRWGQIERVRALAPELAILNHYGPTETTVGVLTYPLPPGAPPAATRTVPLGRPLGDAEVYVVDRHGELAPAGVAGEILVGGDGLARGYLGRPGLTAAAFRPHPWAQRPGERLYRTGDLGRFLPDGSLEFLGRADHQVKIRGYRVELEEIALALARHPEVKAAHVLAPGEDGERRLVAYAAVGESAVDAAELRAFLEGQLPAAMVPAAFVLLPRLPLTANGKVDWRALPAADSAEAASARFVAPRTPTEKRLAELWGELLGVERVSVEQSFFDAGGHSLLAMRLVAEVSHRFGAEIPLRSFVSAPSIAAMAVAIEESAGGEAGPALPTVVPDFERRHLPFPLTEVQEAYWIGRSSSFELGNVATHVYLEYELEGLDVPRLEQALARVIARHEMLRALVLPSGEQQILADVPPYRVETLDLRTAEPTEAEAALAALRERMSHQQLPFERWPLFEVRASLLPGEKVRLHVSSDAIIRDAWSFRVVSEDLLQAYQAPQDELPPLGLSFRDYVLAEVAFRDTSTYRRSLAYWQERLETLPGAPQLPLAVAPGSIAAPRFTLRSATLPRERWQALKRRAAQAGLSPTALVLAVYGEVLAAWSRSPRFTVNLTVFNRFPVHPDVDRVVGDFTSLLLAEVDLAGGGPFEAQARALQERLWADLDHRHVSGVRVLRELARKSGAMGRAVAPVVLTSVLGFTEDEAAAAPTLPARLLFNVNQTPQVWLDHQAMEEGGALLYNWAAVEELFPAGVLEAMFAAYGRRLEELCEEASWQAPTPCLVPAEQLAVRQQVNATAAPLAALRLEELVLAQAAAHPGRPAVISRQRTLTFGELERSSRALARELLARGTRPQELVAVVMEKGWQQAVAALGVLMAGAAYLPIDAEVPAERLGDLLAQGGCRLALVQGEAGGWLALPAGVEAIEVSANLLEAPAGEPLEAASGGVEALAYVIFTSGSTGRPKGVMIDHRGAVNTLLDVDRRFEVGPEDRVLGLSALNFDLSVYDLFGVLGAGGALVLPAPSELRDPSAWSRLASEHQVTLWNTVPALAELWVEYLEGHPQAAKAPLRTALLSGDWLPITLPDRLRALWPECRVVSLGGATEASVWSILYPVGEVDPAWKSIPYGKPMVNQSFHVLDDAWQPRPDWVSGELFIGGVGVALGYYGDAERTAASFCHHPRTGERLYRTGDLGRTFPDGNIEFLGREDLQVKIQGHRIELGEIEAALGAHPGLASSVVVATPRERGPRRLVAFVVPRPGAPAPAADELRRFLEAKLSAYMVPSSFHVLEALPLSANGKVDRAALPLEEAASSSTPSPAAGPLPALAQRVAELVAEVLKVPAIDPHRSLLELGATSIDMVRIANRLEDEVGLRPPIHELFARSVLEAVGDLVGALAARGAGYGLEASATEASFGEGSPWRVERLLRDPVERERFKKRQPGLREGDAGRPRHALAGGPMGSALEARFLSRRSRREFDPRPIALEQLSGLFSVLRQLSVNGEPKYLYGSAGGLYPVQTYLYLKPGRAEGLPGGTYAYHPVSHDLVELEVGAEIDGSVYGWISQPIFEAAAFALYLVAQSRAIVPMYGDRARDFSWLEAGLMTQLLELEAPQHDLGLCQIGGFDFERVKPHLLLDDSHVLVHSLVGGAIDRASEQLHLAEAEVAAWEEGQL